MCILIGEEVVAPWIHLVQVHQPFTKQGSLIPEMIWWKLSRVREALVALTQRKTYQTSQLDAHHLDTSSLLTSCTKKGANFLMVAPHSFEARRLLCSEPADRECLQFVCALVALPVVGADHVPDGEGPYHR